MKGDDKEEEEERKTSKKILILYFSELKLALSTFKFLVVFESLWFEEQVFSFRNRGKGKICVCLDARRSIAVGTLRVGWVSVARVVRAGLEFCSQVLVKTQVFSFGYVACGFVFLKSRRRLEKARSHKLGTSVEAI